jgi:hypothetical protein
MNLLALQRDFRAWLAEESEEAAERLGAGARPGLGVYLNNYRAQLIDCLSDSFERVRLWLGEERFLGIAAAHIDLTPPHAWTLDAYAACFPDSLERLFPDDPEVAELGWLDLALSEAFVGPDADPVDPATLAGVDWDSAVLRLTPTLATRCFTTNAAAIWSALSAEEAPPAAQQLPGPTTMLVWRKEHVSCFRTAEPGETGAIGLAQTGAGFAAICAGLIEELGEEQGVAAAGALLGQWIRDGMVVGVD